MPPFELIEHCDHGHSRSLADARAPAPFLLILGPLDPRGAPGDESFLAAAHAGCYAMALSGELAGLGHAPDRLQVTAVSSFDKVGDDFRMTRMDLEVNGSVPGIEPTFEKAAQAAKDGCPVSNALKNNVEATLKASLA